ncbi:DUF190 domain-containing protein [Luteibacter sp. CQ10]|uniref:DUF190 domain-containing protein n=1 Tax=Luteibacter sp. CQ10 TaxID=2805821 RepID=UPI0034A28B28
MNDSVIRFYMHEGQTHQGALLYKWLLERARNLSVPGGSVFKAIAGYGRHRVVHDNVFVEHWGN